MILSLVPDGRNEEWEHGEFAVIPSERSESRNLHFFSRGADSSTSGLRPFARNDTRAIN